MNKKQTSYAEELTNKRKAYWCYICNSRSVIWNRTGFICKKCGSVHTSVSRHDK
jgi:Zn finger protein HypA/HybF involved in hydrogenase expression